jgi:hypothetical protein
MKIYLIASTLVEFVCLFVRSLADDEQIHVGVQRQESTLYMGLFRDGV